MGTAALSREERALEVGAEHERVLGDERGHLAETLAQLGEQLG